MLLHTFIFLFATYGPALGSALPQIPSPPWNALNQSVGHRLFIGHPMAVPCFNSYDNGKTQKSNTSDNSTCNDIQQHKTDSDFIVRHFGGYPNANWGQCQATRASCAIDVLQPTDSLNQSLAVCKQRSVPDYYIDAREPSDVAAAAQFASKHRIPLVVKNTGHDYKGRSSGPNSLAVWTHKIRPPILFDQDFQPEGCSDTSGPTLTFGAGQNYGALYDAAHEHGHMIVGGTSPSVGASGGYVQGGGHSVLSPVYGLAVDNVMQMRVVLANGTYATANRCLNQDLFFALRGGGGGTFGVVMETTTRVHKETPMQFVSISFSGSSPDDATEFNSIAIDNGPKWADEGWGGYIFPGIANGSACTITALTPRLTLQEAQTSMKPITDFASSLSNLSMPLKVNITTLPIGFYDYFQTPQAQEIGAFNGLSFAFASRLVPRANFDESKKAQLLEALLNITVEEQAGSRSPYTIFMVPPAAHELPESDLPGGSGYASVTPAWRKSVWHVLTSSFWDPNDATAAPAGSVAQAFHDTSHRMDSLRAITTEEGGAYQNEADTFEPDPIASFWGQENYDRLLKIKREVDPQNVFTCHQCVGWNEDDWRYGCYPKIEP